MQSVAVAVTPPPMGLGVSVPEPEIAIHTPVHVLMLRPFRLVHDPSF